jgi:hypothetical protein
MKYPIIQKYLFFFILGIGYLTSCNQSATISRPDVSHISVDVHIERFDQELAALTPEDIISKNTV